MHALVSEKTSSAHLTPCASVCIHLVTLKVFTASESSLWDIIVARIISSFDSRYLRILRMVYVGRGMPYQPPVVVKMLKESAQVCR